MFSTVGLDKSFDVLLTILQSNLAEAVQHCLYLSNTIVASTYCSGAPIIVNKNAYE